MQTLSVFPITEDTCMRKNQENLGRILVWNHVSDKGGQIKSLNILLSRTKSAILGNLEIFILRVVTKLTLFVWTYPNFHLLLSIQAKIFKLNFFT